MGRYTGPKGRINRRLGTQVFENSGAIKALEKRDYPPGMAQRRRKVSNYGLALMEKQKIKFYYGIRDQQLHKYFDRARRMKGNTGEQLLILCERRLDNVVRRAGFTATRPQARQGIVHSHFQINGVTVNKPSILVRPGDVITVRKRPNLRKLYENVIESSGTIQPTDWINFDAKELTAIVTTLPTIEDVSLPVDVGQVVAFMSR
jgi:small subunit ribosomal protein S4